MRERLITWIGIAFFGAIVVPWCGCIAIYNHRDVNVRVVDGETHEPLAGTKIEVRYMAFALNPPTPAEALTDGDGRARMRLATLKSGGYWTAHKNGYIDEMGRAIAAETNTLGRFNIMLISTRADNQIEMFRLPRPTMAVQLPQDYQGLVRLVVDASLPPEQWVFRRDFQVQVGADGWASVPASGIAQRLDWNNAEFRYPEGTVIQPMHPLFSGVPAGTRRLWLGTDTDRRLLYVGESQHALRLYEFINNVQYTMDGGSISTFDFERFNAVFERGEAALSIPE